MRKLLILMAILIFGLLVISGCASQEDATDDTPDDINGPDEVDTLDEELDSSELDTLDEELDDLTW